MSLCRSQWLKCHTFFLESLKLKTYFLLTTTRGDYEVKVRDRAGNIHHCTLEIQNMKEIVKALHGKALQENGIEL